MRSLAQWPNLSLHNTDLMQEVVDSNPTGGMIFFLFSLHTFVRTFLQPNSYLGIQSTYRCWILAAKLHALHLATQIILW